VNRGHPASGCRGRCCCLREATLACPMGALRGLRRPLGQAGKGGGAVRGVVHPAKSQCRVGILIVMAIRVGMVYRAGDATRHAMVLGIAPIVPTAAITLSMDWPNLRGVVK
jgi:hypothetical protein